MQNKSHSSSSPKGTFERQNLDGYRAAHAIVDVLVTAGVTDIYGKSCPTALFLAAEKAGIRQIGYRTENAGIAMADGAARQSRKISVITAQNGPAAALLVAGLAEAIKASVPILAIVQEVPRATADKNAFQEFDHETLFSSCAKWVKRINLASRAGEYVERAIQIATSGRPGPVVLLIAPDILTETSTPFVVQPQNYSDAFGAYPADRSLAPAPLIDKLALMIASARQPLLVAGGGVHHSDGAQALAALQVAAGIPVATTNMGKGLIDETHPLSIGVIGNTMGTRAPTKFFKDYINHADLIIFIGTRTNENGTAGWSLFPTSATFAQIDIDPEELGRNYPALRLLGDARETLVALTASLKRSCETQALDLTARTKELSELIQKAHHAHELERNTDPDSIAGHLHPELVVRTLDTIQEPIAWVADASYSSIWLVQYIKSVTAGMRVLTPRGIAGLGWGFPMAIGAKIAAPEKRVICLTGDGGFAHCWAEMETAKRHGVGVTIVVLNNGVLGFQINAEHSRFGTHTSVCHFGPLDHVAIARACGCAGIKVTTLTELKAAIEESSRSEHALSPFLIDVQTDPEAFPPLTAFESQRKNLPQST
jgi:acetolactate synthase-1/2/3 large subunit